MLREPFADVTIEDAWARIDAWLADNFPEHGQRLAGPASEEDIATLERELGVRLPDDYRASLRIHAGGRTMPTNDGAGVWADSPFDAVTLLAPRVVLERRAWLRSYESFPFTPTSRVTGAIARAYHHPGWIPIASADQGSIYYCLDSVPTDPAAFGQIVEMITNDPDRRVPWPDFRTFLIAELLVPIETKSVDEEALADDDVLRFV